MVHAYKPRNQEAETVNSIQVQGQIGSIVDSKLTWYLKNK